MEKKYQIFISSTYEDLIEERRKVQDTILSMYQFPIGMESGKEGFNMACILLFGKPETIQSCVPGYKTDAIYRVENLDRYDDRLIVENNLMESYNLLIDFIKKHTDDKFFLIDGVNVSLRTAIARDLKVHFRRS